MVDYEPLAGIAIARSALAPGARCCGPDSPGNVAAISKFGDAAACDAAFALRSCHPHPTSTISAWRR